MLRRLPALAVSLVTWPLRVAAHRRVLAELGALDDRGLADIGLARQDLRDATALPSDSDPTAMLTQRARERESQQRRRRPPAAPGIAAE